MTNKFSKVRDSWIKESKTVRSGWAIDAPLAENGEKLSASGAFNSPVNEMKRPYPICLINFVLTWNNGFSIKADVKRETVSDDSKEKLNEIKLFERQGNEFYIILSDSEKYCDSVEKLLTEVHMKLFPVVEDKNSNYKYIQYWLKMITEE